MIFDVRVRLRERDFRQMSADVIALVYLTCVGNILRHPSISCGQI